MLNSLQNDDPQLLVFVQFKNQVHQVETYLDGDQTQLSEQLGQLQSQFQAQVQTLSWEDWPGKKRSLLRSIQVEMHKQMRLITTDLMFFRAAKQAHTLAQKQRDIRDRLTNLQGYCDAILKFAQGGATDGPEAPAASPTPKNE